MQDALHRLDVARHEDAVAVLLPRLMGEQNRHLRHRRALEADGLPRATEVRYLP